MPGADTDRDVGRVLGQRYRLERRIGIGASAVVYQATDLNLRRSVAVKQLKPELSGDTRFIKLFRSEAHLAGQLDHPNIVTVHDWSADEDGRDGGAYIVTEHVAGGTLRQLLDREGPLAVDDVARMGLQVAQGLRAAHAADLVHRDIKPGNLLVGTDGRIRIGDFGIARAVAEAAWTEPEGHLIGTARYAAPEQGQIGEVNGRADIYSLGVCLHEMATGEVPLVGDSALATMMLRREVDLPADPTLGPLAELVAWAGMAEWAARPSAEQLVDELAAIHGITGLDPVTVIDLSAGPRAAAEVPVGPIHADPFASPPVDGDPLGSPVIAAGPVDGDTAIDGNRRPAGPGSSPLGDRTDDGYLTTVDPDDDRRRSRLLIGGAVLLFLVAGGLVGGWLLAASRDQPTEVVEVGLPTWTVPDAAELGVDGVVAAVTPFGWEVVVEERPIDGTTAGQVIEQRPAPGEVRGPGGTTIELVVSQGPVPRQVPTLVGRSEAEARRAIDTARLTVGTVTERNSEDVEAGVVLEAIVDGDAVAAGAEHPTGTDVDLVISSGPAARIVPDLVGLTGGEAEQALTGLGLVLEVRQEFSETVPEGRVMTMSPVAGSEAARDSTVTVTISLGLPLIAVPDLTGRPVLEAVNELSALGFTVRIEGAAEADVLGTRPQAGSEERLGATVTIVSTQE